MSIKSWFVHVESGEWKKKWEEIRKKERKKERGKHEERENIWKVFENFVIKQIFNKLRRKIASTKSQFVYIESEEWMKKWGERGKKQKGKERGKSEERENRNVC